MPTTEGYNGAFTGAQIDEAIGQVRGKNLPADGVKFTDGETFQQKYDAGELTGPQGPQGDKGEKGDKGDTGGQGPAGAAGANGKSAYQAAVEAGYTGTEEQLSAALAALQNGPFLPTAGGTMTGNINMGSSKINGQMAGTDYTTIRPRGISLVSTSPGTLPNGCIAIVYS